MRRRRRYEVVVEGLSGQAASQRSVISDHRSEAEARENASLERARLEVIYGDGARSWRILVMRDDEMVAEEIPHGGGEPRRRAAERAPRPRLEPVAEDPAAPLAESPEALGEAVPVEAPVREGSGPVPGWLIARVEESISRQRDRTYGPAHQDDDDRGGAPRR